MKRFIFAALLAVMCLLAVPQQARAQYAYGASGIGYDPNTKVVLGYSRTSVDYWAGAYYDPYVEGFLYDPVQLRDWDYDRGYEDIFPAVVETGLYSTPSTRYDVISDHYVISWYSTRVTVCDYYGFYGGCGYDPYGFSGYWGGWYGGYNYFYGGYGGYVPERTYYLGSTGISGVTPPPDCGSATSSASMAPNESLASGDSGGGTTQQAATDYDGTSDTTRDEVYFVASDYCEPAFTAKIYSTTNKEYIQGTSQKAMLGATIALRADLSDDNTSGAAYEWKIGTSVVGTSQELSTHIDTLGSQTLSLAISRGSIRRTASVTVSVEVPELNDAGNSPAFFGDELVPDVDYGVPCINEIFDPNMHLKLGCPARGLSGMQIDAAIKTVPKVISNRAESKLKFVQLVNTSVKRVQTSTNACTILTKRNGPAGTLEWLLDASDPYGADEGKPAIGNIDSVNQDRGSTVSMNDSPALRLVDGYNWTVDDKFESYFVYYTGTEAQPQNQKAIGVLEWSWGGATVYNASAQDKHSAVPGSLRPAERDQNIRGRKLTPTNNGTGIRQYDPSRVQDYFKESNFKSCGGTTTPPGGGTVNNGTFVTQTVPSTVAAGSVFAVSVTVRNSGDTTWTPDVYKLGSQNARDNTTWGTHRIYLPDGVTVPPGSDYTFNFNVTAPSAAGLYNFQWQMVREGVAWFGDMTPNVAISVTSSGSSCSATAENNCYANGGDWDYSSCTCNYYYDPCGGYVSSNTQSAGGGTQMPPCYTY